MRISPSIVVFTTLFPTQSRPGAGLFIRERMFRVAQRLPVRVVSPQPWFPLQGVIRRWYPDYRPCAPRFEHQDGIEIQRPRFLSIPGGFRWLDGMFMAIACLPSLLRLRRRSDLDLIDAHFAYPDGYAATLIGAWLGVPVTITVRGTEVPLVRTRLRRLLMKRALKRAHKIIAVSESLRRHVIRLGATPDKTITVGNGVDVGLFRPLERAAMRERIGLAREARVLISVGGLVERKGFHRVIQVLPDLRRTFPDLQYLIVGGGCAEGDWSDRLRDMVRQLGLEACVQFVGYVPPDQLAEYLSAADVFVLSTRNEGWANVFLEAMACGLPVVTTDVGGNREVVNSEAVGEVVPFDDASALEAAIDRALRREWDKVAILGYARANTWDRRVNVLVDAITDLAGRPTSAPVPH